MKTENKQTSLEGFTPGEWKADKQKPTIIRLNEFIRVEQTLELDNCDSARAYDNFTKYGEAEANAALIAEAKNMYEALKELNQDMYVRMGATQRAKIESILNRINKQ